MHLLRPDPLMSPYVTIRLAYPLLYVQLLCTCAVYLFVVLCLLSLSLSRLGVPSQVRCKELCHIVAQAKAVVGGTKE